MYYLLYVDRHCWDIDIKPVAVCVYVSVCLRQCVSLAVCVYVSVCLWQCVSVSVCVSGSVSVSVCVCVSVFLAVCVYVSVCLWQCVSLAVCVCVGVRLAVCVRTFGDAVLCGQEPLLQEALQHGAHRGPVDQLQHKQVGLWRAQVGLV